jgi:type VI secretion system protein ImpA
MLQFDALLEPISETSPAGEDLTFSAEVDAINKARQFDDPTLDQGEWITEIKEADWQFVFDKCSSLLEKQTKDLRIGGWLVEAATKTRQFDGMAAGIELLTNMCARYWEELHPRTEDSDNEQRIGNLAWLLKRSVQLVKEIPLTEGRGSAFSWIDFEAARARANNSVRTGEVVSEDGNQPTLTVLESARRKSSKNFYQTLISGAVQCQKKLVELERILDERLGISGPSFMQLKDTLATIQNTIERFGADIGVKSAEVIDTNSKARLGAATGNAATCVGAITSREQALEQLRQVAEFFRRTEPHSPVAYLADKAATWGDLPLHTWLKTVIKDPNSLTFIEEMLGIKPVEPPVA